MRIIEHQGYLERNKINDVQKKRAKELVQLIAPAMQKRYCDGDDYEEYEFYANSKIEHLIFEGIEDVKGLTFLDLGCGNNLPMIYASGRMCEPWFCRSLVELGAKEVIGIDIGDNSEEIFKHYKIDLTRPNSLGFLPSSSVDVATCFNFFDSPDL